MVRISANEQRVTVTGLVKRGQFFAIPQCSLFLGVKEERGLALRSATPWVTEPEALAGVKDQLTETSKIRS